MYNDADEDTDIFHICNGKIVAPGATAIVPVVVPSIFVIFVIAVFTVVALVLINNKPLCVETTLSVNVPVAEYIENILS
jgi:hypothetical protein